KNLTWQDAAERMTRLRAQGDPWTSQRKIAEQIGCSTTTVNKAIRNTPKLQPWAKPQTATACRAQSLNDVVTDRTANPDPNPADEAGDAELRKLMEETTPDERAFLNRIRNAPRDYQWWYIHQPEKARVSHRKAWKQKIEDDSTREVWFNERTLQDKLDFLDDPGEHQKVLGRKA